MWTKRDTKAARWARKEYDIRFPNRQRVESNDVLDILEERYPKVHDKLMSMASYPQLWIDVGCAIEGSVCINCKRYFARIHLCPECTNYVEARWKSNEIKRERTLATCRERYGVDNPMHTREGKAKVVNAIRNKYGVDNIMHLQHYRDKARDNSAPSRDQEYRERLRAIRKDPEMIARVNAKSVATSMERYGVPNPMLDPEIKAKQQKAMKKAIERFGGQAAFQQHAQQRVLELYGVTNVFASPEMQSYIRSVMFNRYGYEHALQIPDVKERALQKALKNRFSTYEVRLQNKRFTYMGYELPALLYCVQKYGVKAVNTGDRVQPIRLPGYSYFPDIQVNNFYIEVKSLWTLLSSKGNYKRIRDRNAKLHAMGVKVHLWICNDTNVLMRVPYRWFEWPLMEGAKYLASKLGDRSDYFIKRWRTCKCK